MEYEINREQDWTPESFAEEMRKIRKHYIDDREAQGKYADLEDCHWTMDVVMIRVLTQLGYGEGTKVFANTNKWYA